MNISETPIIETKDLRKTFPGVGRSKGSEVEAVRSISFEVRTGEVFGLLGPNGAGKTTTMRLLSTLMMPTSGTAKVAGFDLINNQAEIRNEIGYMSQVGGMEREATGRENLMLQAQLYDMDKKSAEARVSELIDMLELGTFADRRTSTYSGGQRRIFDLASGIVHRPRLLFLDEPSTGLDPQNRVHVWDQVKKLRETGTTIFLTTHYLEEADALCDRVAIVDHGRIVVLGTPDELKRQIAGDIVSLGFDDAKTAAAAKGIVVGNFIRESQQNNDSLHLYVDKGEENMPVIMKELNQKNIIIKTIQLSRPTLDDVFLKLTGRSLRDSDGNLQ